MSALVLEDVNIGYAGVPVVHAASFAVAEGDSAQRFDRDLAIDLSRCRRAVTDEIADRLQREVGVDQTLHTGMAQRVRSRAGHLNTYLE